jgi:hypothetical protein
MYKPVVRNAFYFQYRRDLRSEKSSNRYLSLVLTNNGLRVSPLALVSILVAAGSQPPKQARNKFLKECVSLVFVSIKCPIPGAFFFDNEKI